MVELKFIEASGFLSFGERARLDVGRGLTVVTGPNGAGKSNLGRCLDVARAVIGRGSDDPAARRLELYGDASYEGGNSSEVRLGLALDEDWERELVWAFVCACYATVGPEESGRADERDEIVRDWLVQDSLAVLWSGSLVVGYEAAAASPWFADWEFGSQGAEMWHVVLAGEGAGRLVPGPAMHRLRAGGARGFFDWLLASKPGADPVPSLDFGVALKSAGMPVTFSVQPVTDGWVPESVRRLGSLLGMDYENRGFRFDQVMSVVLQRGVALTDNRRLPLRRHFGLEELGQPADLRDGSGVAAELYRLKNGCAAEQARFAEIRESFGYLTGRELAVRARPLPPDGGEAQMVIEPTVAGRHGERLVELSGAGIQEALVLSVLLDGTPGRVTVLDEPAVNLEPAVQRRLTGMVRGPGQYLVITHNADLVPFEELSDLERIVCVRPGQQGSVIFQPGFADLAGRDQMRQLQLLEPAEVRGLLFAGGVILCEGQTEVGALPRWWRAAPLVGLPDPGVAKVSLIGVPGQSGYGAYLRFVRAFGLPWAILADGPALRPAGKLAMDLREQGCWPSRPEPDSPGDFTEWREFWELAGVFTFADCFGDDGSKGGEFEAFLRRVDSGLFARAMRAGGSKPRAGAFFALEHEPPQEVFDVYARIAARLGIVARSDSARS